MTDRIITLWIPGRPAPSGSLTGFVNQISGKVNMTPASKYKKPWMDSVRWAWIQSDYYRQFFAFEGPVRMDTVFYRVRLKGHYGKTGLNKAGRTTPYPITTPDLSKLLRSTEDALTGYAYKDDAQIVEHHSYKKWGDESGCEISIQELIIK